MKKIRAMVEIASFIVVGSAAEKVIIPEVKKQVKELTSTVSTNPFYRQKEKVIVKPIPKTKPKPIIYTYSFYKTLKTKKPLIALKPSIDLNPFKTFMKSKEKWMEKNVKWKQSRMGYSSWDRDPEFFGWVIWITKPGQFKSFVGWLKRLRIYKN